MCEYATLGMAQLRLALNMEAQLRAAAATVARLAGAASHASKQQHAAAAPAAAWAPPPACVSSDALNGAPAPGAAAEAAKGAPRQDARAVFNSLLEKVLALVNALLQQHELALQGSACGGAEGGGAA